MLKDTVLLTRPSNVDDSSDATNIPRDVDKNFMSHETPFFMNYFHCYKDIYT